MIVHVVIKLSARVGRPPVVYTKGLSHFGSAGVCPPFLVRLRLRRLHVLLVSSARQNELTRSSIVENRRPSAMRFSIADLVESAFVNHPKLT